MKTIRMMAAALLVVGSGLVPLSAGAQQTGNQAHRPAAPRSQRARTRSLQVRVDIGPGAAFGRHRHPGEEIIYVIEGSLVYEIDGKPPVTLKAGEVLFIPAGTIHAAKNVGSSIGSELATYIVEKGKPLLTLVD
jgi:quercetin dioxygenase-like cupin family protein